jgi:hypothetical protein
MPAVAQPKRHFIHGLLAAAEAAVLKGQQYALWANPYVVIKRCKEHIRSGLPGCPCLLETTITANVATIQNLAATRHRVVHDQADAKRKFDAATLQLAGRTYAASRPGKFLRDWDTSTAPRKRWIDVTIDEMAAIIRQVI